MSFSDPSSPFMPSLQSYIPGSDAINILPQFSMDNEGRNSDFDLQPPPYKRARNSEENQSNSLPFLPMNTIMIPPNAPVNKGTTNIFFKTRLCAKFKMGMCRNGENCNFAHGSEDMRQPPANWQELVGLRGDEDRISSGNWDDDQKIIHRMKLCKKFYNGEECPYGDRCNFLHEDPSKYRDDSGRFRESSAISIGTSEPSGICEDNKMVLNAGSDPLRGNVKPVYWKTKLCNKWEQTGHCPFGEKCHFAHGLADTQSALHKLQASSGRVEGEVPSYASISTKPQVSAGDSLPNATTVAGFNEDVQGKKCLLKWKGPKKINRIYADWLDDLPLVHNLPSRVES
ncbi:Zinc finger CCCH domain-containing protein 39 [Morus notabilis]|uniref:Zinc finger CCCH domain-containing protein 39 n=1 Tax=Morus notabilis TaxID=981085 RepID=W9QMQ1_9ROSA|nr:zinc finger CCCH domain-containing protein 39 [Morus notabilis]EXB33953.1 Zinc finger CCCH domain-containing protein 39 [Morus notabilis]